jgi:hypothetical protein
MAAHICNPSYSGGRDPRIKNFPRPPLSNKKLDMVELSSYAGSTDKRTAVQASISIDGLGMWLKW